MVMGSLTLALLLLAPGADPDVVPMSSNRFKFPIQPIPADQKAKIKELVLYFSDDQGKTWRQAAVAAPDKDAFVFYAPADGLYWFNIGVVDVNGVREPADLFKSAPRGKVLVDTLKPNIRIVSANRKGDDVEVRWEIQEDHPDLSTLKVEYHTSESPAWMWYKAALASPALSGQTSFRFAEAGPLTVRVQLTDAAGNLGTAQAELPARSSAVMPPAVMAPGGPGGTGNPAPFVPAPEGSGTPQRVAPSAPSTLVSAPPTLAPATLPPVQSATLDHSDRRAPPDQPWVAAGTTGYRQVTGYGPDLENRSQANTAGPYPPAARASSTHWPGNPIIPYQITNNTQVALDYKVSNVGPSGVGSVELYLTRDEGRTWDRYAANEKLEPPMIVNLPGEGIYGLRLVVASRAGLGQRPPQSGDLPQMRIAVDTTEPMAKLFYPQADPQRRDALILTWTAKDNNELAANPITLQWAERPDGIWKTIAADLSNSGRFTWQLTDNIPYRVYLRLSVRDTAGNVAIVQTPEPVLIDLHEPEGQILGIAGTVKR
jgi:hypothetical protein